MSSRIALIGATVMALALFTAPGAWAEQSGTQPQPSPSPSPSPKSPLEQAKEDTDYAGKKASDAFATNKLSMCWAEHFEYAQDLEKANAALDKAIEHEIDLHPDVKDANQELDDAKSAEDRAESNPKTPASDLVALHKKTTDAAKKLKKTRAKHKDEIGKRLAGAGYVFGTEEDCKEKTDVAPSPKPKQPHPKKKIGEDDPRYMENYTPPANKTPSTPKTSDNAGSGPSQSDVDRQTDQQTDQPANENDKQPEIPVPH